MNQYTVIALLSCLVVTSCDSIKTTTQPQKFTSFEYDVSLLPKEMWPEKVHLLKQQTNDEGRISYLNCGLISDINKSGRGVIRKGTLGKLTPGEYQIRAITKNWQSVYPEPIISVMPVVTIRPNSPNEHKASMPIIDNVVEEGDVTIRGKLVDDLGKGVSEQSIYLIVFGNLQPKSSIPSNFRYFYPKQITGKDGEFQFVGVIPNMTYQVEHWKSGRRVSCHSVRFADLAGKQQIGIILQQKKTTVENPYCPIPASSANKNP